MKYRKKPVVIEAFQLPEEGEDSTEELQIFLHAMKQDWSSEKDGSLIIHILEGDHHAMPGDFIIKGIQGEYYPCKPDIFEQTYELVENN